MERRAGPALGGAATCARPDARALRSSRAARCSGTPRRAGHRHRLRLRQQLAGAGASRRADRSCAGCRCVGANAGRGACRGADERQRAARVHRSRCRHGRAAEGSGPAVLALRPDVLRSAGHGAAPPARHAACGRTLRLRVLAHAARQPLGDAAAAGRASGPGHRAAAGRPAGARALCLRRRRALARPVGRSRLQRYRHPTLRCGGGPWCDAARCRGARRQGRASVAAGARGRARTWRHA